MDFISWAGVRHNRVAQLEPGPYDAAIAGYAERDQDQVGLIVGFKDSEHAYYRGSRRVTAERLDLSNLFLNLGPDLPIWHLDLVFNIVTALNKYYGLAIDPVEIKEAMDSFDYTGLPKPLTITAKDDAITCRRTFPRKAALQWRRRVQHPFLNPGNLYPDYSNLHSRMRDRHKSLI